MTTRSHDDDDHHHDDDGDDFVGFRSLIALGINGMDH